MEKEKDGGGKNRGVKKREGGTREKGEGEIREKWKWKREGMGRGI